MIVNEIISELLITEEICESNIDEAISKLKITDIIYEDKINEVICDVTQLKFNKLQGASSKRMLIRLHLGYT